MIPLVSIVIPSYNRPSLLKETILSIQRQSYTNREIIIVNNDPDIETEKMIAGSFSGDPEINFFKIRKSKVKGISEYLNFGIIRSKGKYIARLDDDDTWLDTDKLKIQVEFFESNPDYVLLGGGVVMADEKGKELYRFFKNESDLEIRSKALLACPLEHTTVMFRKDAAVKAGLYNPLEVAEDWDFFLRLGKTGKMHNFQKYFTTYYQGENNYSLMNQSLVAKTEIEIIKRNRHDYPSYQIGVMIHYVQYYYSFLPEPIKKQLQFFLRYLKRTWF